MNSKSLLGLSNHGIAIVILFLSLALDDRHQVEAQVKPSYYHDADQYTDTHDATKFKPSEKKLYFFAGPHASGSTSVEAFFSKFSNNGFMAGHPHTRSLKYWRWPYEDYGRLVKNHDDTSYRDNALDLISDKFHESDNGVFLGTKEFDQVGPDKWLDAMPVMESIVDRLGVDHKDIKVVLVYRAPRVDQWISIWKHAGEDYADASYEDFMCKAHANADDKKYRFSMIGAQMNPLNAAKIFLERGWRVALLDMGGIEKADKHLVHAIGCDILMGGCENGVLKSLSDYKPHKNAIQKEFNDLNEEETAKIEKLFRSRDCSYQSELQKYIDKGQMEVLYKDSLWADCTLGNDYYKKFKDNTRMIYDALLGQLGCTTDPNDVTPTMDAALGASGGVSSGGLGGGGSNALFFVMVLMAAVGYSAHRVLQHNSKRRQEILKNGGDIDVDDDAAGPATITEMTSYSAGGFRDDDKLDEDISDQNGNNPIV